MCGTVKFEGYPTLLNQKFPENTIYDLSKNPVPGPARWNGFCRRENLQDWLAKGWRIGTLKATSFIEKGVEFTVPAGREIGIVMIQKGGKIQVNIVTRAAEAAEVEKCGHNRMPALTRK